MPGCIIEVWQANAQGRYAHPGDEPRGRSLDANFPGLCAFEGDKLCYEFGNLHYCGFVLRNPGGTRAMENEFIWDAGSPFTFSQVE